MRVIGSKTLLALCRSAQPCQHARPASGSRHVLRSILSVCEGRKSLDCRDDPATALHH
jgi:hypothetical protein